jgi:5-hydroxyisourate hydrolase-like protein (transthyretin family)
MCRRIALFFRRSHFLVAAVLAVLALIGGTVPAVAAGASGATYQLTGQVRGSDDERPIPGAQVDLFSPDGTWRQLTTTDENGWYAFSLPPGEVKLHFSADGHFPAYSDGAEDFASAEVISIEDADVYRGVLLNSRPSITGRVADSSESALEGIRVELLPLGASAPTATVFTNENGRYRLPTNGSGDFTMRFSADDGEYPVQWYGGHFQARDAKFMTVAWFGQHRADLTMMGWARVHGTVVNPHSEPLSRIKVEALEDGVVVAEAHTDETGDYTLEKLDGDKVKVRFSDPYGGHVTEYWNDVSTLEEATEITLYPIKRVWDIDAMLDARLLPPVSGRRISGEVTNTAGDPLPGIKVDAYLVGSETSEKAAEARTGRNGRYSFTELEPGTYKVHFTDPDSPGFGELAYAESWFDGAAWFAEATPITVAEGVANDDVDAVLARYGGIRGNVRDVDGTPLADIEVEAHDADGRAETAYTDADGNYVLDEIRAGSYRVRFADANFGNFEEWHADAWGFDDATPIAVRSGEYVENIDARLTDQLTAWDAPRIVGTPQVGGTLTANPGRWNVKDTPFEYTWLRGETKVGTGPSYTPTADDLGHPLRLRVQASTSVRSGVAVSAATEPVRPAQTTPPAGPAPQPVPQPTPLPSPVEPDSTNTSPVADLAVNKRHVRLGAKFRFDASASRDAETPTELAYLWAFGDGHTATGPVVRHRYAKAGVRTVTLTIVDPSGATDRARLRVGVAKPVSCGRAFVQRGGSWRITEYDGARGDRACDNLGAGPGKDLIRLSFQGPRIGFTYGRSRAGGVADVIVDGRKRGVLRFHRDGKVVRFGHQRVFTRLGAGEHTVRVVVRRGIGHLDDVLLWGAPRR